MEGHMFDAAINTAFNALGNIPTVAAQKAHLDLLRERFSALENELGKLRQENIELLREYKEIKTVLENKTKLIEELTFNTVLADIGPCKIKIDTQKNILPGYYCPKCHLPLTRGDYSYQKDILICHGCREISLKGSDVDSAKEIFIQTRFQK